MLMIEIGMTNQNDVFCHATLDTMRALPHVFIVIGLDLLMLFFIVSDVQ